MRRILRRAVRYATEKLNAKPGFFGTLVNTVVDILGDTFPEIRKDPQAIIDIINEEEEQFLKTLSRGRNLLNRTIQKLEGSKVLPGDVAWRLYDTYGFPVDLTQLMSEEKGLTVDMTAYEEAKKLAQLASQGKGAGIEDSINLDVHAITELQNKGVPPTDDSYKYDYSADDNLNAEYVFKTCQATVIALRCNKQFVDEVTTGQECGILLDKTCFYAEQGGQIYDLGYMVKVEDESVEFSIKNVQVRGGYIVHIGNIEGTLKKGDKVNLHLDTSRRRLVMNNHTGTHILNFALRKVLGTEADQRGSLVAPDRLRFDFTNKGALLVEQVKKTELASKEMINKNQKVYAKEANLSVAKTVNGLRAVFEETYPDPVRIVSVGVPVETLVSDPFGPAGAETSVEFCGGTHVHYAGHIGDFVIASEEAIAKGIRRIVALTGPEASKALKKNELLENRLNEMKSMLEEDKNGIKSKEHVKLIVELTEEISKAVIPYWKKDDMRTSLKNLKKKLDDNERAAKAAITNQCVDFVKDYFKNSPPASVFIKELNAYSNTKALDAALKQVRILNPDTSAMFFSVDSEMGKIFCLASVPKSAVEKGLKANEWVGTVAEIMQGKGGGKADSAQASGKNINSLSECLKLAEEFAKLKLRS